MNIIIALILIVTVGEVFVCHFTLWWLLALISRILFSLRIIGATIKIKTLCILEVIALASMLLFNMIFAKGHIPWLRIGLFALCMIICCGLMFIDDLLYVYVIEDEED